MVTPFDLGKLIHPIDPQQFVTEYVEQKPLVLKREDPHYYDGLLTLQDVDFILRSGERQGNLNISLSHAENTIRREDYTRFSSSDKINIDTGADFHRIFHLFNEKKATMIIHNADAYFPPLKQLIRNIEGELLCRSGVNVFITPSQAQCFQAHYDEHDLFIIQVAGAKQWKIFENYIFLPLEPQNKKAVDFSGLKLLHDVELEAGDILYLPRGFVHEVKTTDTLSCHITLGIHNVTWLKLFIEYLTRLGCEEAHLRRSWLSDAFATEEARVEKLNLMKQILRENLTEHHLRAYFKNDLLQRMAPPPDTIPSLSI